MKIPSLPEMALQRPVTVIMLTISMICLGVIAQYRIPLEFMPKLDFPFIGCYIPYPGATPEQVQNEVAIPAEGQFRTLSNLRRITTQSDSNGCNVRLLFNWEADLTLATAEVRDRMERLKLDLPDEIDRLFLQKFSSDTMPIMMFSLYRAGDIDDLAHLARTRIQPRIARLDGVADVQVFSKPPNEVLIEFDQNRLRASNLGLYEVVDQLRRSSINMAVGELYDGNTKHFVRVLGEFDHPEQLAELNIGAHGLRLKEVADVGFSIRDVEFEYAIDGKQGAFMLVRKESEANAIATCDAVKSELARVFAEPMYAGMDMFVYFDQSDVIMAAVNGLLDAGKYGGVLALLVLFLFLRRVRPTIVVALAIPSSLVVSLVYMFFAGLTLNLVTITAMIIAIGLLVDNSIVVIENIYRHLQLGFTPYEAAKRGASEVGLAVSAATLTTLVVFVPTFYLEQGEMAIFMKQFAAPVAVALIASLVIALTLIPLAVSRMKPREHLRIFQYSQRQARRILHAVDRRGGTHLAPVLRWRPFKRLVDFYIGALELSLRWRAATILLIAVAGALTAAIPMRNVGMQQMPTVDTRQVDIAFLFDQNFDFAAAQRTFDMVENAVNAMRDELDIKNIWRRVGTRNGEMTVYLKQPDDLPPGQLPKYTTEDTLNILWQRLPDRLPGVELRFSIPDAGEGQSRSIVLRMRGDDMAILRSNAENFARLVAQIPGITDVDTGDERERQEMQIHIDQDLAEQAGTSPMVIAQTVDFALRGIRLPYMKRENREIPVWAQFREEDRKSRENLENVGIVTQEGAIRPLNEMVNLERALSPDRILRVDGKNVMSITARTNTQDMGQLFTQIRSMTAQFEMPRGYTLDLGDEFAQLDTNMANFMTSLLLSTALIFFVMAALFESYFLPLSILTCIPVAFMGVFWALYLTSTSFDTIAFIGIILMVGIVVNNGIVIVDYINQLRKRGMDRNEAVLQAGRDRVRPVLMTALTTILGCVPLALEQSAGSEVSFASLGRALIGGLTTGTVLTLYVVPVVYTIIDDFQDWSLRFFADFANLRPGKSGKGGILESRG